VAFDSAIGPGPSVRPGPFDAGRLAERELARG